MFFAQLSVNSLPEGFKKPNSNRHLLLTSLLLAASLSACSTVQEDATANWSPNKLYKEAKDEASSGGLDKAIALYDKLEGRAAGTPLAQQAQLERAYAQYKNGEPTKAIETIDRFIKLNPASPALDYALYLKGTITFNDKLGILGSFSQTDLSERDQKAARESFTAYKELVTRFPDSKYSVDAKKRLTYIVNSLAQYEVHVANYYYSRKAYIAAINRAQQAISDFQEAPALEEAMLIIVKSYDAMGMTDLRNDATRVLEKSFPNSASAKEAKGAKSWWKLW